MKFLILSDQGQYLPIALKLQLEKHDVSLYIIDHSYRNIGQGLVPTVDSYLDLSPDITIIDSSKSYQFSKKAKGKIFGVSEFFDTITKNKKYFEQICALIGLEHNANGFPDHSIESWFTGEKFTLPVIHHKYYSELMSGCAGDRVQIGHMGVQSYAVYQFGEYFSKLSDILSKLEYRGPVRLGISKERVCRIDNRLTTPTLFELLDIPLSKLIDDTVSGRLRYLKCNRDKALAIRISTPPFPYCPKFFWGWNYYKLNGVKLFEYNESQVRHMWLQGVYKEHTKIVSSGHSGDVGYVTSRGLTLNECMRRAYRTIDKLNIPNMQYRNDIGLDVNLKTIINYLSRQEKRA